MRHLFARIALLAVTLLGCMAASAGTAIDIDSTGNGPDKVLISGDRIRIESADNIVLFDAARDEISILDPAAQQYTRHTRQEAENLVRRLQQTRAQIEQQLQYLPEAQREQWHRRMDAMMPGLAASSTIRLEDTGATDRVAGTNCRLAKLYRDGRPTHRVCVAQATALGIPPNDEATLNALLDFAEAVAASAAPADGDHGVHATRRVMTQLGGMPVRAEGLGDNTARWTLAGVQTRSIDAAEFTIPEDYTQREVLGGLFQ